MVLLIQNCGFRMCRLVKQIVMSRYIYLLGKKFNLSMSRNIEGRCNKFAELFVIECFEWYAQICRWNLTGYNVLPSYVLTEFLMCGIVYLNFILYTGIMLIWIWILPKLFPSSFLILVIISILRFHKIQSHNHLDLLS